ncbi:MAG: flagellar protein FliS [Chitinivibrionales bacterium]|nr:flagellar protein FliS [Chitinivibrionales bacterium]
MPQTTAHDIAAYYSRVQILSASKARLLCMLHEKCLFFCIKLRNNGAEFPVLAPRIQNILAQLQMSLIVNDTVSKGLFYLYDYCYVRLNAPDPDAVENVFDVMLVLFETFSRIARRR